MEEKNNSKKVKKSLWYHVKMYLIGFAVYCGIFVIVGLFFIQHFRHFWISHHEEPLTEYTITGRDYDLETSKEVDDDGKSYTDETYTYYLILDVKGKTYWVETDKDLYERVYKEKATHFDTDDEKFYYDSFKDKVFLGGYYSIEYYAFLLAFVIAFCIIFVYIPITRRKEFFAD